MEANLKTELNEVTELVKRAEYLINTVRKKRQKYINDIENIMWDALNEAEITTPTINDLIRQTTDLPDLDEGNLLDLIMKENGFEVVNDAFLLEHFPSIVESEFDAEGVLNKLFNWESDIEGAMGGIGLYYSNRTKQYYYIIGKTYDNEELKMEVEQYSKKDMEDFINHCLDC
jgi:hypothetical protein